MKFKTVSSITNDLDLDFFGSEIIRIHRYMFSVDYIITCNHLHFERNKNSSVGRQHDDIPFQSSVHKWSVNSWLHTVQWIQWHRLWFISHHGLWITLWCILIYLTPSLLQHSNATLWLKSYPFHPPTVDGSVYTWHLTLSSILPMTSFSWTLYRRSILTAFLLSSFLHQ